MTREGDNSKSHQPPRESKGTSKESTWRMRASQKYRQEQLTTNTADMYLQPALCAAATFAENVAIILMLFGHRPCIMYSSFFGHTTTHHETRNEKSKHKTAATSKIEHSLRSRVPATDV